MRKFFAWLGAAALVMVSLGTAHAAGPTVLKPYIVLILDVSGSMQDPTNSGPPSCADAQGGLLPDNKLNHARCAINNIVNTYGDIVFAFARFREDANTRAGDGGALSCGTNATTPTNCHLSQDACNTNSDRFQLLTALDDHHCSTTVVRECLTNADCPGAETCVASNPSNASNSATWADFSCSTCSQGIPFTSGNNPETWNAVGSTPLLGSLAGAECYWAGLNVKQGHCSVTTATSCERDSGTAGCPAGETCVFDPGCSSSGGIALWGSTTAGFSPIVNDPTDQKFLPTSCNPSASCFATVIAAAPTGATETGTTATYVTTTPHGLKVGDVIKIVGVSVGGYNGTGLTVASILSATSFTVAGRPAGLGTSGGGTEVFNSTATCCQTQCRPYITIMLTDGDETCGGSAGQCSNSVTTPCSIDADCGSGNTCNYNAGTCSVTTATKCFLNGDCPQGETCQNSPTLMATAAAMLHTVVASGSPAIAKQYRVETKPIGFGTPVPYGPIENLAKAGGATVIPGQNSGFYAQDEAGLELAISQIIEGSVRSELCNGIDDDCDGAIDEDFPQVGPPAQACDNGLKGVCLGTGQFQCSSDGTGVVCNITSPGGTPQTTCPGGQTCSPDGTETCSDGLDNDCDGFVDEGCTTCTPIAEICDGVDNNCNGIKDDGIPPKQCGAFPGAACSPNTGCCGTQSCFGPGACPGPNCGHYTTCNNTWTPVTEACNNIDDDCDGIVDEDLSKTCSNLGTCSNDPTHYCEFGVTTGFLACTGTGTCNAVAGGPATNNPGDPSHSPIPQNLCHPGNEDCTAGAYGSCGGEAKPSVEICDGLDNDCDNVIDEDTGGGSCNATCGVGTILCAGSPTAPTCCQPGTCAAGEHQCGTLYCSAVSVTTDTTCDDVDDNCNGTNDEQWTCGNFRCTGLNVECTGLTDTGCPGGVACIANTSTPLVACTCTAGSICNGQNKCITGGVVCQGTPIDPSSCCDCAGNPQSGSCTGGASCANNCMCEYPCSGGEFPCPSGKKCDTSGGQPGFCVPDPCFGVTCTASGAGNAQTCYDNNGTGVCIETCDPRVTTCPTGLRCYGPTGQCDPDDCTAPFPDRACQQNQNCIVDPNTGVGQCVANLCSGVTCPSDQYCEQGNCIASCAGKSCPGGQRCRLGVCEPDPCGHPCPFGRVCNDSTGACIDDPCQFRNCPQGQWCNPNDGMCEADPCVGTMCPADPPNQVCKGGTCYNAGDFNSDGGAETHVTVAGGGCSTGGNGAGLVLVLGVLLMRRRRSSGGAL